MTFLQTVSRWLGRKTVELPYREFGVWKDNALESNEFVPNFVSTSKYSVWSFFPVNLFEQLTKPANMYFLLIAVLQVIPGISLTGRLPTVAIPLTVVILVTMVKDGIEDYHRHVGDNKENSKNVEVVSGATGSVYKCKWGELNVGDVILLHSHDQVPADILLLCSSDAHGLAYVETSNLDGESNLKLKSVPNEFLKNFCTNLPNQEAKEAGIELYSNSTRSGFRNGVLKCQLPNNALYQFEGSFRLFMESRPEGGTLPSLQLRSQNSSLKSSPIPAPAGLVPLVVPLNASNLILRGCSIRNTDWLIGLVVYTGNETKIQMNSLKKAPKKISSMDKLTGEFTLIVFGIQMVCCLVGVLMWGLIASNSRYQNMLYLDLWGISTGEIVGRCFMKFFSYMILFSNFIPISLTVTIGVVKLFQSMVIEADESMGKSVVVRSSDLNEELGQIGYIFSDKTGTLTRNVMEFRKCCIGGDPYGQGLTEIRRNVLKKLGEYVPPEPLVVEEIVGGQLVAAKTTPNVNFIDDRVREILRNGFAQLGNETVTAIDEKFRDFYLFFFSLAVNHSVMIEFAVPHGEGNSAVDAAPMAPTTSTYSASNPDEGALCYGAKHFGFKFVQRTPKGVSVEVNGRIVFAELLASFDFSSARKRSSVLVRVEDLLDNSRKKYFLFSKGADSVMIPRLSSACRGRAGTEKMIAEMNQFCLDGLRTLCVCVKEIKEEGASIGASIGGTNGGGSNGAVADSLLGGTSPVVGGTSSFSISDWLRDYNEALSSMDNRSKKLAALADRIEFDLELVGVSAIEDKLQDNVGDTIDSLRKAGIKVWMLTGDKMETAINIGLATSLLASSGMYHAKIDHLADGAIDGPKSGYDSVGLIDNEVNLQLDDLFREKLVNLKRDLEAIKYGNYMDVTALNARNCTEAGLIIDGTGLEFVFKTEEFKKLFAEISSLCSSVICCRVSPEQKGSVVRLIRKTQKQITLAIGDGANDCNMIQAANIGVGLIGEEGMQAFNASDYGVKEFQSLRNLVLIHGRWCYRRISKLVLYVFYKNVVICLPSYFLNVSAALFSGQLLFEEYMYQLFNVFFTTLPIILFGIFEQDLNKSDCIKYPEMYQVGPERNHANKRIFVKWLLTGLWHSVCVFYIPYSALAGASLVHQDGIPADLWLFGVTVYLCLMIVISLKLALETYYLNGLFVGSLIASFGMWFAFLKIIEVFPVIWTPSAKASTHTINISPGLAGVPERLVKSPMTLFIVVATVAACLARDFIFKAFRLKYRPKDYHSIMLQAKLKSKGNKFDEKPERPTPSASPLLKETDIEQVRTYTPVP